MNIEDRNLHHLRQAVSEKFGKEVKTAVHCTELALKIEKKGQLINSQTFRRFFGLIKSTGGFSNYTLDTLAQYIGHQNFAAFKKSLIENELDLFLGNIGTDISTNNYWKLSEDLCAKVADSPALLANVHHQLLKYPLARTFFIEHHPMRDLAGTVYAQYFHDYLKYERSNEAKLFAHGFLYIGAFLTENEEFMDIHAEKIRSIELTSEVYVLPAGRKFGVQLLQAWRNKDDAYFLQTYQELLEAKKTYQETSEKSVCSFEYSVLEHLIFTDKTDVMRFLIENTTSQRYSDKNFVPEDRKKNHDVCWNIMCATAYLKMKEYDTCKIYLDKVQLQELSLGWKKYYAILYYFVKYEFAEVDEKEKIKNKLRNLIEETYFTHYYNLLKNLDIVEHEISEVSFVL